MNVLVSAGPTREPIDPVRFLTNRSSGKMGYAIAEAAARLGHSVRLVSGPVSLSVPPGVTLAASVETAAQMADAMKNLSTEADIVIMCAAVADYRPVKILASKMKKSEGNITIELERTEDILKSLGSMKHKGQILVGFAAETDDLEQNALGKMKRKNLDWIVANKVGLPDRGFASENNAATLYCSDGRKFDFQLRSKISLAEDIVKTITGVS